MPEGATLVFSFVGYKSVERPAVADNLDVALCHKAFQSSADDAQLQFQAAVSPVVNLTNIFGVTRANFSTATFSTNFIKYLNGTIFPGITDPRFGVIPPTTSVGANLGMGTTTTAANLTPSSTTITDFYGGWYARDLADYLEVITYHELKFIEVEADLRAGNRARALRALKEGIAAHMRKIGVGGTFSPPAVTLPTITEVQVTAYLASVAVPQTEADLTTLRPIME